MTRLNLWGKAIHVVSVLLLCGCGGKYDTQPVRGRVTLIDGTPLPEVRVTFEREAPALTAMAVSDAEGNYVLGTVRQNDGAPAGKYRVAVVDVKSTDPDRLAPLRFHPKYTSYATSGLGCNVERGRNVYDITLELPPKAPRR